jgi:Flp pilus assembly protein TadD
MRTGILLLVSPVLVALAACGEMDAGQPLPAASEAPGTADAAALEHFRAGQVELARRGDHLADAIRHFEAAVERDPGFAGAWGGLALARTLAASHGLVPGREANPLASEAARRSLELDSLTVSAHVALSSVAVAAFDHAAAERSARRAIALDPSDANAHTMLARALEVADDPNEAVAAATRAVDLDPATPVHRFIRARQLMMARRYDEAEAGGESPRAWDAGIRLLGAAAPPSRVEHGEHRVTSRATVQDRACGRPEGVGVPLGLPTGSAARSADGAAGLDPAGMHDLRTTRPTEASAPLQRRASSRSPSNLAAAAAFPIPS